LRIELGISLTFAIDLRHFAIDFSENASVCLICLVGCCCWFIDFCLSPLPIVVNLSCWLLLFDLSFWLLLFDLSCCLFELYLYGLINWVAVVFLSSPWH